MKTSFSAIALCSLVLLPLSANAAAPPKVDVSPDSITCKTVIATATIKPTLVFGGPATSIAVKIKGTVDGCTVSGPNSAIIASGKFSGTLTGTTNDCLALLGSTPLTGSLTFKWKADKTTPLLQTSSVVTTTTNTGSFFAGAPWAQYFQFDLGISGVTGAFTGGDAGTTSTASIITSQDVFGAITSACSSAKGLKTINLGLGTVGLS